MKITIVQAEIETAIENFVLSQMKIEDDQELVIELSATRGPDGMTAEIKVQSKATTEAPTRKKAAVTATKAPATVTKTAAPVERAVAEKTAAPIEETAVEEQNEENTSIAEQAEATKDEEVVDVAPAGKSIFGPLARPTNG